MPRKRTEVSISQKAKICQIKKTNLKLTQIKEIVLRDMGLDLGISTISEIVKDESKWQGNESSANYSRLPTSTHNVLKNSLLEWISQIDAANGYITEEIIIEKAKEFGRKLNITDLTFSKGWLHRFKTRYNLKMRTLHGEAASMSDVDVQHNRKEMAAKLCNIDPETILNMDETGLFFQAFPTKTISSNERKGVKQSKVRITVALCSNATGTFKAKPFLIGHCKKPRCFKNFNVNKFCVYHSNSKAWMTTDLFNRFMEHLSEELKPLKKNFTLLIDNAPSHILTTEYSNISVIALPKNSMAHLQPIGAGIIRNSKLFIAKNSFMNTWHVLK